jgi:hypothetical protein
MKPPAIPPLNARRWYWTTYCLEHRDELDRVVDTLAVFVRGADWILPRVLA